jgi:hypothetical protein
MKTSYNYIVILYSFRTHGFRVYGTVTRVNGGITEKYTRDKVTLAETKRSGQGKRNDRKGGKLAFTRAREPSRATQRGFPTSAASSSSRHPADWLAATIPSGIQAARMQNYTCHDRASPPRGATVPPVITKLLFAVPAIALAGSRANETPWWLAGFLRSVIIKPAARSRIFSITIRALSEKSPALNRQRSCISLSLFFQKSMSLHDPKNYCYAD